MKVIPRLLISLTLLLVSVSLAQNLSDDEILTNLKTSAETLQDASFVLTGNLIDPDGTKIPLELNVSMITDAEVARAEFIQPDALADNFIVVDSQAVYNYVYLTNQATIFNSGDPDALGGLFPEARDEVEERFDFNISLEELYAGWEMSVTGYEESPAGNVYVLRFDNIEEDVIIDHVIARFVDESWHPYALDFFGEDERQLANLVFNDFVQDQGLNPDDLTYIPADAELIDER